jgi:hypothetical protein
MENFHLIQNGAGVPTFNLEKDKDAVTLGTIMDAISGPSILRTAMVAHDTQVQMNFTSQEMEDQTLSPGKSTEGFVYFAPVIKGEDWTRNAVVQIKLLPTKKQNPIELKIPISN